MHSASTCLRSLSTSSFAMAANLRGPSLYYQKPLSQALSRSLPTPGESIAPLRLVQKISRLVGWEEEVIAIKAVTGISANGGNGSSSLSPSEAATATAAAAARSFRVCSVHLRFGHRFPDYSGQTVSSERSQKIARVERGPTMEYTNHNNITNKTIDYNII
ncbi:hypothetical protein BDU57DRAFT_520890 [Ampelomyces quisqualis]|uniref:Uncharacterized protein n=1 Tax=Ampelomyces quisqualis TaxID=50730 RepID=A0A6A5QG95_AMPQU|nr:hypothetical protein BDU57DRAFT_520890 [Ampelomyces quisqualis]